MQYEHSYMMWLKRLSCQACLCELAYLARRLSAEQKALILAYAELEKGVEGTVDGVARTQSGRRHTPEFIFFFLLFIVIIIS